MLQPVRIETDPATIPQVAHDVSNFEPVIGLYGHARLNDFRAAAEALGLEYKQTDYYKEDAPTLGITHKDMDHAVAVSVVESGVVELYQAFPTDAHREQLLRDNPGFVVWNEITERPVDVVKAAVSKLTVPQGQLAVFAPGAWHRFDTRFGPRTSRSIFYV